MRILSSFYIQKVLNSWFVLTSEDVMDLYMALIRTFRWVVLSSDVYFQWMTALINGTFHWYMYVVQSLNIKLFYTKAKCSPGKS